MICPMCGREFQGYHTQIFCKDCMAEKMRAKSRLYYQRHRERLLAYRKDYYAANRAKCLAKSKEYKKTHREEINLKLHVKRITGEYRLPRV